MMLKIHELEISGYERVVEAIDEEIGFHCYIAIHNTSLGPALGGARIYPYSNSQDALDDVLRLAKAMTKKSALAEIGLGGGKSVIIADPHKQKTTELLHAFGQVIDQLKGSYIAAEDVGSTTRDMALVKEVTPYVAALTTRTSSGDPSRFTAWGVLRGMEAVAQKLFGAGKSLKGLKVAVQGLGSVGSKLVGHLFWHGADLIICDIDSKKTKMLSQRYQAQVIPCSEFFSAECDILAPCAMGGALNSQTIPLIRARAIAGSANNQLQDTEKDGEALFQRGILYAPDYIINAGGVINASMEFEPGGYNPVLARDKVDHIFDTLLLVFKRSEKEEKPTHQVADELAEYNLQHLLNKRDIPIQFH